MTAVSPMIARSMVLRCLPRLLRTGLDNDGRSGSIQHELVRDLGAVAPALEDVAKRWLDAQSAPSSAVTTSSSSAIRHLLEVVGRRSRLIGPITPGPEGLAPLDRHAAETDDETVRLKLLS